VYQKFYSDNVLENAVVDSTEIADYYNEHRDAYPDKSLDEVTGLINSTLREQKVTALRTDLAQRLREKYQPVINEDAVKTLLKEE
jgi:hypothetical protein